MRCLVTGATGFVGPYLTELLLARGNQVIGTYTDAHRAASRGHFDLCHCDITDRGAVLGLVRDSQPEQVYHLAGFSSPIKSLSEGRTAYDTNFYGTLNLLEAIEECKIPARILLVGSSQCYGNVGEADLPIREDQPFAPRTPYAVSKAAADLLGLQFSVVHKMHVVRARPANHTGPGQTAAYVCSDFARQLAAIELGVHPPELRVGNIDVSRDFCDVRDVVRAYFLLLEKGRSGEAYNVGSGRAIPLNEIVSVLASFCSRPVEVIVESKRTRSDDPRSLYVSINKIEADTGWKPGCDLRHTLHDLYSYWVSVLKENPNTSSRI